MIIFGYKIEYYHLTYQNLLTSEDTCIFPSFGIGYWTFNLPIRTPYIKDGGLRQKRPIIGNEKGLYIHIWLFSHRFDIDFRKQTML